MGVERANSIREAITDQDSAGGRIARIKTEEAENQLAKEGGHVYWFIPST